MFKIDYCADSFAYLKLLPENCVDVTITDPPYDKHTQANLCSGSLVGTKNVPKYELDFAPLENFDFIGDLLKMTKRWVVVFCTLESFGLMKQQYPKEYIRGCVWGKKNAMGQLTGDRPATAFEGIALFHKPKPAVKKRWNGRGSYGIWSCNGTRGKKDRHPNEKPVRLCQKLVSLFSERGETVFDPFSGSAAIGESSLSLGRHYAGLDFDLAWVKKGVERLNAEGRSITDEEALTFCKLWGEPTD